MKFSLDKIREARDYAELLANLNGFESELRAMMTGEKGFDTEAFLFGTIEIKELLGE